MLLSSMKLSGKSTKLSACDIVSKRCITTPSKELSHLSQSASVSLLNLVLHHNTPVLFPYRVPLTPIIDGCDS